MYTIAGYLQTIYTCQHMGLSDGAFTEKASRHLPNICCLLPLERNYNSMSFTVVLSVVISSSKILVDWQMYAAGCERLYQLPTSM